MKSSIRLLLAVPLLLLLFIGCSKSDDPVPDRVFKDIGKTMEDRIPYESPTCYYNYFRVQNASDHTLYWGLNTKFSSDMTLLYIRPGEQSTDLIIMEYFPGLHDYDILIDNLMALGAVEFYFNAKPISMPGAKVPNKYCDTCAIHIYTELLPNSPEATPKDPTQWQFEKFSDHRVRWTYRITDADHAEAVRQTLERWKDRPKQ